MLAIEAHGLRKVYNATVAVDSLDISVEPGMILGFLGPNGAGKTSVIRVLSTVLRADGGSFAVAGVPHTRPTEIRRRVGVLPESAGYPAGQTGEEWLAYHGQLFGLSGSEAMVTARRLLAEVGLSDRRRSRISEMSRGMRQRLGIARALVNDPQVLLADEPTGQLDSATSAEIMELIAGIHRQGRTVVLVTHDASTAACAERSIFLHDGRIVHA